jgi:hypothetical protein
MLFPAPLPKVNTFTGLSWLYSPKTVHIKHPCGAKLGFAQGLINALQIFKSIQ